MSAVIVHKLSTNFRQATRIDHLPGTLADRISQLPANHILVRTRYLGINASDINMTAGRYDPSLKPPFIAGFEAMGVVEHSKSPHVQKGALVQVMTYGAFADLISCEARLACPVPELDPKYFGALVSGQTAALALKYCGRVAPNDVVLVTAAAGAAGQMAVQYAKKVVKAKTVIGTCSNEEKASYLKHLGCDLVINYKKERIRDVLKEAFPNGVDVVFESVGGDVFRQALSSLAVKGRLIVIGSITSYKGEAETFQDACQDSVNTALLLQRSTTIAGFFLNNYSREAREVYPELINLLHTGELEFKIDHTSFLGINAVADAVEYLHTGKNVGKVIVSLPESESRL